MIHRLKTNGRFLLFNSFGCLVLIYVLTQGSTDMNVSDTFDPGLESGKWAVRFLLICLAFTPLRILFGWNDGVKLRKSAGLWCFFFACLHVYFYITFLNSFDETWSWLTFPLQFFIVLGLAGLLILSLLAITSNRWSMRQLKKNWKRLHRLVYTAGILVLVHAILATNLSKKMFLRDPDAIYELYLYLILLGILLLIRVPIVRRPLVKYRKKLV